MTDTPEAVRLADLIPTPVVIAQISALLRRFPELEAERDQLRAELEKRSDPMQNGTENDWRSEPWSFGEGLKTYKTTTQEGDK